MLQDIYNGPTKNDLLTKFLAGSLNATRPVVDRSHLPDINQTTAWLHLHGDHSHPHRGVYCRIQRSIFSQRTKQLPEGSPQFGEGQDVDDRLEGAVEQGEGEGDVEEEGGLGGDHLENDVVDVDGDDDDDDDEDHQGVGEGDAEGRDGDQEEGGDPNHLDRHPLHRVRADKLLLEFQHPREKCVETCLSQRK